MRQKAGTDLNVQRFHCYDEQVNTRLFDAALQLAITTTDASKQIAVVNYTLARHIWYEGNCDPSYFESLGIRYFGELLERFEEKIGADARNLRALALAMAYASPILTEAMYVADQRAIFLDKVRNAAAGDIYLTGAMFLMADDETRNEHYESLVHRESLKLEEIIFALSVIEDNAAAFDRLRPRIISLLESKQLPVAENAGVYGWFLATFHAEIKSYRKANNALLRAYLALTDSFVREKDGAYRTLIAAGYCHEEITQINLFLNWDPHLRRFALNKGSIPAEKLATAFVLAALNANAVPSSTVMEYVRWLFQNYFRFTIKYQGFQGLWAALKDSLKPALPEIVVWMTQNIKEAFDYRFDVLDARWDMLATELEAEYYHDLFREQLLANRDRPRETVERMLDKYQALTGTDYLKAFESYSYIEGDVFSLLVDLGIIDLWDFLEQHKDEVIDRWHTKRIQYVLNKVRDIEDRAAFVFWQRFTQVYGLRSITDFWSGHHFHAPFVTRINGYHYQSGYRLKYKRDFLSREENRQLYEWIDASVFAKEPDNYTQFAFGFLENSETYELFDVSEVRQVFDMLQKANPEDSRIRSLKARFLSAEEMVADRAEEEAKRLAAKQLAADKEQEEIKANIDEKFSGTYRSLVDTLADYRYRAEKRRRCAQLILELLPRLSVEHRDLSTDELGALLRLYATLAEEGLATVDAMLATLKDVRMLESALKEVGENC